MKKIYLLTLMIAISLSSKSQYVLTQSSLPLAGDVESSTELDTLGLTLGTSGTNQTWNYSSITSTAGVTTTGTFVAVSAIPNASLFTNATLGKDDGSGTYEVFNGNGKKEMIGKAEATFSNCVVYNNPINLHPFPFAYGNSHYDTFNFTEQGDTYNGNLTTTGDGSGTLILPSYTLTNVLKLKTVMNLTITGSFAATATLVTVEYHSAASKFAILSVSQNTIMSSFGPFYEKSGTANPFYFTNISNVEDELSLHLYPNPVLNGELTVQLKSKSLAEANVQIFNALGQTVLNSKINAESKNTLDVSSLGRGIYFAKISQGKGNVTKKIIIQ